MLTAMPSLYRFHAEPRWQQLLARAGLAGRGRTR
jgi:hypothetical protein